MATINVLNATGGTEAVEKPLTPGRAAAASSRPVALSTEDAAYLDGIEGSLSTIATITGAALPAGTALIGKTAAGIDSSTLYNGTTAMTPKFNTVRAASSSGDTTIVAAVTSKKIRVLNYVLSVNGAVNVKFKSATAGDISGLKYFDAAGAGAAAPYTPAGHFETTAGEALVINLSAAVAVGIDLTYVEV
jgi:hypothetical protein